MGGGGGEQRVAGLGIAGAAAAAAAPGPPRGAPPSAGGAPALRLAPGTSEGQLPGSLLPTLPHQQQQLPLSACPPLSVRYPTLMRRQKQLRHAALQELGRQLRSHFPPKADSAAAAAAAQTNPRDIWAGKIPWVDLSGSIFDHPITDEMRAYDSSSSGYESSEAEETELSIAKAQLRAAGCREDELRIMKRPRRALGSSYSVCFGVRGQCFERGLKLCANLF